MPDEHPSQEIEILRVKKCIDIALRCVIADRKTRPSIKDVVDELEQLETEIMKMSLPSDETKDLIAQVQPF